MSDELENLQKEYASYRKRARKDIKRAEDAAKSKVAVSLLGLVDDLDRALHSMAESSSVKEGVESLRDRTVSQFENVGLFWFGQEGDEFDVHKHEAIHAETLYPGNRILEVHERGWMTAKGKVVRVAKVSVSKSPDCPNGDVGCRGDCAECQMDKEFERF